MKVSSTPVPEGSVSVVRFEFTSYPKVVVLTIADTKGGNTLFSATYARDNANQLTSDSSAPSSTGSYKYTTLNQVCYAGSSSTNACGSPPSGSTPYTYDAADNLTQTGSTQQAFNNADELCWTAGTSGSRASPPTGATTYLYDTRGNRTTVTPPSGGATNLSYDQANRLTAYGSIATYAYNGDHLRMSKTVSGTTSQFLWDVASAVPLLLKDGSTAYVYGPGGLPMEQINGSTVLWLHHDQLGSTRLVTDTTGASQATYAFDPYGNITASTGTITNPMRFAGQYRDGESSLYYLRARYYDPATGQFLSRDPAVATTREPYAFVGENPLNATDPSGLCDWNPLSGGFCGYQTVSKTPLGNPLAGLAAGVAGAVSKVHDHGVAGYAGCSVGCVGASYQGGVVSVSGGGVGDLEKGPYAGVATKKVNERHATSAACSLGLGVGATVSVGVSDGQLDWSDFEFDVFQGVGWQLGYMYTAPVGEVAPLH